MLKETILSKSLTSHALDEDELKQLVDNLLSNETDSANLGTATAEKVGQSYMIKGVQYVCEDKGSSVYEWETYDTSGQNLSYADASGKPSIDGITLNGALTKADLEIAPSSAARTSTIEPSGKSILLNDNEYIVYDNLEDKLANVFDISNLPKYETYNNPLLTSDGTTCEWSVTHTCKTNKPIVQVFTSGGIIVTNLALLQHSGSRVSIQITSAVNIAANAYYVVLIG